MSVEEFKKVPLISSNIDLSRIREIKLPISVESKGYISIEVILNVDNIPMITTKRYDGVYPEMFIITEIFYFDEDTYEPYLWRTYIEKL